MLLSRTSKDFMKFNGTFPKSFDVLQRSEMDYLVTFHLNPTYHYIILSQLLQYSINLLNKFKVNIRDPSPMSVTSFWCFQYYF